MRFKTILLFNLSLVALNVSAQTDADALRYSGSSLAGTARFTSMSGAFGALGGDFSSISVNPAGLGIYRSNELTISPSIYAGSTESTYLNKINSDNKLNFNLGNLGLVFSGKVTNDDQTPGWKTVSFGLGYNRIHNFNNRSFFEGQNRNNSILDLFVQNANGNSPDNLDSYYEGLAYNAYLINPDSSNQYTSVIPFAQEIQRRSSETKGSIGETVFAFAANYSNRLYVGGSLNFRNLRYTENTTYEEVDPDTTIPYFKSFSMEQNVTTRGNGVNLKLGLIYKATDYIRLGASFHTPTWYSMRDEYNNIITANLDTGAIQRAESPLGSYEYNFSTPLRVTGSVGFIIGQSGLVSADYDVTDYSNMRYSSVPQSDLSPANNAIRRKYTASQTVRIGTEWRYEAFSFRGGASFGTSPFTDAYRKAGGDFSRKSYSAGIGLRDKNFFLDFGYVFTTTNEFYQPYTLSNATVEGSLNTVKTHNFVITTGWKF